MITLAVGHDFNVSLVCLITLSDFKHQLIVHVSHYFHSSTIFYNYCQTRHQHMAFALVTKDHGVRSHVHIPTRMFDPPREGFEPS